MKLNFNYKKNTYRNYKKENNNSKIKIKKQKIIII